MQSARLLRTAVRTASRLRTVHGHRSLPPRVYRVPGRPFCTNPVATPRPPGTGPQTQAARPTEAVKPVESPSPSEAAKPVEAAKPPAANKPSDAAAPTVAGAEQAGAKIPDVPSTSLGFEDPDSKDPLKWKKFAFKYAGAVLLFMVSYKTLHWYVDRLEADGKRQRAEVEENKAILSEISAPREPAPLAASSAAAIAAPAVVANKAVEGATGAGLVARTQAAAPVPDLEKEEGGSKPQEEPPPMRIFDPVKEEEPHLVSELEELHVYKVELEGKLRDLRAEKRTREIDAEKLEIKTELKALAKEIQVMEAKEAKKANS